jgi:hypothetical protein
MRKVYVFRRPGSDGANNIVLALKAEGVSAERAKSEAAVSAAPEGSIIVCWGQAPDGPKLQTLEYLNHLPVPSKLNELHALAKGDVKVPNYSNAKLDGWLGRTNNHSGGKDLLIPSDSPDYWVQKLKIVHEFRVHVFKGKSIRAGVKVHRENFPGTPHAWIRSYDAGWRLSSAQVKDFITETVREEAKKAVKVLGLDFGAVDVGLLADGTAVVLEVNRQPGNEGGTSEAYARHLRLLAESPFQPAKEEEPVKPVEKTYTQEEWNANTLQWEKALKATLDKLSEQKDSEIAKLRKENEKLIGKFTKALDALTLAA